MAHSVFLLNMLWSVYQSFFTLTIQNINSVYVTSDKRLLELFSTQVILWVISKESVANYKKHVARWQIYLDKNACLPSHLFIWQLLLSKAKYKWSTIQANADQGVDSENNTGMKGSLSGDFFLQKEKFFWKDLWILFKRRVTNGSF